MTHTAPADSQVGSHSCLEIQGESLAVEERGASVSFQDVRRSSPGLERVATSAGATAMRFAATSTPATSTTRSDRHDGDRDDTQVVGECPPYCLTDHHPQRDADDDADKGQGSGLPGHGRGNLAVHEPEHLQEPNLSSAARDAHHEQMEERRRTEQSQHGTKDEREVDRLVDWPQCCAPKAGGQGGQLVERSRAGRSRNCSGEG